MLYDSMLIPSKECGYRKEEAIPESSHPFTTFYSAATGF